MIHFKTLEKNSIDLITAMMIDFYAIDGYPIDIEKSKALFRQFTDNSEFGLAWLIYTNDTVVGYVIITFSFSFEYQGRIGILDELYLSDSARGKGIGKKTVAFIQAKAQQLNLKVIYLEVENHNENAQKLYLASNFIFHHRKLMKYIVK